jgi:hypothetical protein
VLTGHQPNLITTIEFVPAGSMAITGLAPTVIQTEGARLITPPVGSLTLTGERPFRTTAGSGGGSAQVSIPINIAASGTHLLKATITLPIQVDASRAGSGTACLLASATINIAGEAIVEGGLGDLKLASARIQINGIHIPAPSLYWISDGANQLGRATITI